MTIGELQNLIFEMLKYGACTEDTRVVVKSCDYCDGHDAVDCGIGLSRMSNHSGRWCWAYTGDGWDRIHQDVILINSI